MHLLFVGFLLAAAWDSQAVQNPSSQKAALSSSGWVHINGAKNPELIPEWSVWKAAFGMFNLVGELPTPVVNQLSASEAQAVLEAAREQQKGTAACEERVLKLMPLVGKERNEVINRRTQEINLDCRWKTLRLRDRVLGSLSPEAQVALRQWVEKTKAGIEVTVPKAELDFYLKPQ